MDADIQDKNFIYKGLTGKIINIFFSIYNKLGYGLSVKSVRKCINDRVKKKAFDNRRKKKLNNRDNLRKSAS